MDGSSRKGYPRAPTSVEHIAYDVLYAGLLTAMAPSFLYKIARGKYRAGWKHKLGFVPERVPGRRIWIHAVSVGEAVAADILAGGIRAELPGHEIVVSTTTPTGQSVARARFGEDKVFYFPLDLSGPVTRAFARTRPELLVLMELEVWPNLVAAAAHRDVPVVVANGRISDRAFARYRRVARILRPSFRRLAAVGAQNEDNAGKFIALGTPRERVVVTGTLKYDGVATEPDDASRSWARRELRLADGEHLLLGGSTHRTEELALARAWRRSGTGETWRLAIAPRHPERVPEVESELAADGFTTARRSRLAEAEAAPGAVALVDTVGELGRLYHAADLVFVGGSLIPHGGQNPIEPAGLGKAVVFGPHMFNFDDSVRDLLEADGARRVGSAEALVGVITELARDSRARGILGANARAVVLSRKGAAARTVRIVRNVLAGGSPTA